MSDFQQIKQKAYYDKLIVRIMERIVELWKEHDDYVDEEKFVEDFIIEGYTYEDEDNNYEETFCEAKDWYSFDQDQEYKDNVDFIKKLADQHTYYEVNSDCVESYNLDLEEQLIMIAWDTKRSLEDLTNGKVDIEIFKPLENVPKY